ncbi:hypothetical protein Desdi_2824 [Desulfitobacterium dichloroeliminans LMG P-21439]|uniref:Uncharacterized protein n=1 Tax=Desulfitobacterium dichloroeliminans (strain LMG P-21439 / DCA1) TaxID=871963 RepID=L0FC55_DESDL|nr:hypothetical protein [Desulfitobacterium dichloroeliminans]AGA70236.1 hypothetical protein Desdi_2824 [Desulfitobacterium dichloroeliminans LMG P-21439]
MPWMELCLDPLTDWDEEGLADWAEALGAFLTERGRKITTSLQRLPGYLIVRMGEEDEAGELLVSSSERLIVMMGLTVKNDSEREFAEMLTRFAKEMGAVALRAPIQYLAEKRFWQRLGALDVPEPVLLQEEIQREKVGVELLYKQSLLVTYRDHPALCLEPIFCSARPDGPQSLAARRVEKLLGGGRPIGFASRVSAYSPWQFDKKEWEEILAYSRLESYELLEQLVNQSLPSEYTNFY